MFMHFLKKGELPNIFKLIMEKIVSLSNKSKESGPTLMFATTEHFSFIIQVHRFRASTVSLRLGATARLFFRSCI